MSKLDDIKSHIVSNCGTSPLILPTSTINHRVVEVQEIQGKGSVPDIFEENKKNFKKKRIRAGNIISDPLLYLGPWAGYVGENVGPSKASPQEIAENADKVAKISMQTSIRPASGITGRDIDFEEDATASSVIDRLSTFITIGKEYSQFHGGMSAKDYLGRTYMSIPLSVPPPVSKSQTCFLPKKCIHTWEGHQKAVSAIRLLPQSGHLLLSCSFDSRIKLWEVYGERKILRTFYGHNKAVKDVSFCTSDQGLKFASCSYDKTLKIWDTESGSCLSAFTLKGYPFCVTWHPTDPNIILSGLSNRKIYAWDIRNSIGDPIQEFTGHLEGVNSISFLTKKKFVSTSDDKSVRIWDYEADSTPIKTISDFNMHSMPSVKLHPSRSAFAVQSMDNQIRTWTAGRSALLEPEEQDNEEIAIMTRDGTIFKDKYKALTKKFTGHIIAGNACQISFSPDGQYIMSGDSEGRLFFWNWKTGRVAKQLKCHDKVLIGAEWLPRETSKVITCSWDGKIKLWD